MRINPFKLWFLILFSNFFLFSTTGLTILLSNGGAFNEGNILYENRFETPINYLFFFLGVLTLFPFLSKKNINLFVENKIYLFIFGYIYILLYSFVFNADVNLSLVFNYCIYILIFSFFYFRYGFKRSFRMFIYILSYILLLSLLCIAFFPNYGISIGLHEGDWQGVFSHKNQFGIFLFLFLTMLIFSLKLRIFKKSINYFILFILLYCILMTGSATALTLSLVSIFFVIIDKSFSNLIKKITNFSVVKFFILGFIVFLIFYSSYLISSLFGKEDAGYSNRDLVWGAGVIVFLDHPFFGVLANHNFNFESFIFKNVGFNISNYHNSYIEVLANYGLFGFLIIFMPLFFLILKRQYVNFFVTYSILIPLFVYLFMESFYLGKSLVIFYLLLIYFYSIDFRKKIV